MILILIFIILVLTVTGFMWGQPPPSTDTGVLRADYRFLNNTMALSCGMILLLGIPFAGNRHKLKPWWWLILIYVFGVVLITQHRSVWVGLTVGVSVILFRRRISTGTILKVALVLISFIVLVLFLSPLIRDSLINSMLFVSSGVEADSTGSWRLLYWAEALRQIQTSPIFGLGFGDYFEALAVTGVTVSPHNFYIHILFKTGLIGLILQLYIISRIFKRLEFLSTAQDEEITNAANALLPLVWMNLTYFLFYSMELLTGLLIGYILLLDRESKNIVVPRT